MKKGYSKPLTEIELNVLLPGSFMADSLLGDGKGPNSHDDAFDPSGLNNATLVGNSPSMSMQNQATNLWDGNE